MGTPFFRLIARRRWDARSATLSSRCGSWPVRRVFSPFFVVSRQAKLCDVAQQCRPLENFPANGPQIFPDGFILTIGVQ